MSYLNWQKCSHASKHKWSLQSRAQVHLGILPKGFGWGGALAAAAVFAALLITDYPGENQSHKFVRHAATEVGEYKTAVLPDGSKATLNTNSQLETEFETDDSIRKVALLRGEAHFDVEPDPSRPFVVEVGEYPRRRRWHSVQYRLQQR